jgi:hypothetical protein
MMQAAGRDLMSFVNQESRAAKDQELVGRTERDPVNITVFGNPVLDVIVNVAEGAAHVFDRVALEKAATIRKSGNLEFKPDTYICFFLMGEPLLWGPFNPGGQQEVYALGQKHKIPTISGRPAQEILKTKSKSVTTLPGPGLHIGGGGVNVLFGFYDVFARLKVQLIATVEKRGTKDLGRLDPFITPLTDKIGPYTEVPLYLQPGVNLAIEGLGPSKDRTIFTAELPTDEEDLEDIPEPAGKAIMVNTIYSPQVAIHALAHAAAPDRLGLLALTKSLCSKRQVDNRVFDRVLKCHPGLRVPEGSCFGSVYDFVTNFVLPRGRCICVVNEDELENLTAVPIGVQRGEASMPTLCGIVEALQKVRTIQQGTRTRVYVTLGPYGSIVLTERDDLIYCGIYEDSSRRSTGKTAIGDTYATFLLALETIGNYIRPYNLPAQDVIKAAAAGADSGVYDGFGNLAVNKVNLFLGAPTRRLFSLGQLTAFDTKPWKAVGLGEMRDSDFAAVSRANLMEQNVDGYYPPATLQEVLGRAFLRL